ncbi:GNAT family N-acetyltransferase [Oerskovia sp. NPDC060338]|uniref:GNAT family N-acetyltransferase n=1 Tax=Oerskovia sp. NPDC060338 TaxID=3347100 RepID=UPI00364BCEDD
MNAQSGTSRRVLPLPADVQDLWLRLQTRVVEAVRWRVGYYTELMLPPFPAGGIAGPVATLRQHVVSDGEGRIELEGSAGILFWNPLLEPMTTTAEYARWLAVRNRMFKESRGPYSIAIATTDDDQYVGELTIFPLRDVPQTVELAIALRPAFRGKAFGREPVELVLTWLRETQQVHRVVSRHNVLNRPACFMSTSLGLEKEGVMRSAYHATPEDDVRWQDACHHGLVLDMPSP